MAEHERLLRELIGKVDHIEQLLTGGSRPEHGIIVRMDRLEQNEKRRNWAIRTALAGAAGSVIHAIWRAFK